MAKTPTQIASLARSHTETAINCLVGIMNQSEAPPAARVSAASAILDRGWGKPAQPIDGDGEGGAVQLVHRIERVIVSPQNSDG
jgi:CubicO group peptidase (beta-lactamase class C family)